MQKILLSLFLIFLFSYSAAAQEGPPSSTQTKKICESQSVQRKPSNKTSFMHICSCGEKTKYLRDSDQHRVHLQGVSEYIDCLTESLYSEADKFFHESPEHRTRFREALNKYNDANSNMYNLLYCYPTCAGGGTPEEEHMLLGDYEHLLSILTELREGRE
ncbi:MAG: hypothetical protein AB7G80_09245 [Dongiaceae bacterium]